MDKELLKIKDQIKKLNGDEKETLFIIGQELYEKQLDNVGMISYMELFQETAINMGQYHHVIQNKLPVDEHIAGLYKKMMAYLSELPSVLGNFEERIYDIKVLRKEILEYIRVLSAYYTECNYIYEIVATKIEIKELEKMALNPINLNVFYKDVARYLAVDPQKVPYKMSHILSVLPFRLTRQFFFDRVEEILEGVKKDSPIQGWHSILQRYKEHFDGSSSPMYGKSFRKFYDKIEEYKKIDYKNTSEEEFKNILRDCKLLLDNIKGLTQTCQSYCAVLNRILVLHELKFKDFERVFEGEMIIPEIYKGFTEAKWLIEEIEPTESVGDKLEALYELCRGRVNELYVSAKDLNELFSLCMEKLEGKTNETLDDYLRLSQKVMAITNDFEYHEEEALENSDLFKDDSVKSFLEFLSNSIKEMPGELRRVRMRKLLCVLPVPFQSPEEFFDYMKSSLEFNTLNVEKAWAVDRIGRIMDSERMQQ